jgi:SAM-dependent methyltransferase
MTERRGGRNRLRTARSLPRARVVLPPDGGRDMPGRPGRGAAAWDRVVAAVYDRVLAAPERAGLADDRAALLAGASGRVLEVGPGTGANLAHLPPGLAALTLVEPSPAMRARLTARIARLRRSGTALPAPVRTVAGDGAELPLPDGGIDTVVMTLVLCSVPDPGRVLAEVRRVLAPGGRLLLLEHVAARGGRARRVQRLLTPVWRRVAQGCHLDRDTRAALVAAGFDDAGVVDHRVRGLGPAILGTARPR